MQINKNGQLQINKKENYYLQIFLIALVIALSFILPYMIIDKGPFLFYGDYSVQQVPFISLMHDSLRSGNIFWSWYTDLGSNFLGSYAFYDIGSPFFWLTLPFPNSWVVYTIGPILCLKIAVAAVTAFAFIQRFVKSKELAVLGGLLYAFSSWSIYDIFFNHFHDAMALFPLMLIALEELMINDRKGFFALTVFINVFVNYFFFVAEAIFLFIYWVVRSLSDEWKLSFKKFFILVFESVLGLGISAILLLPALMQVSGNTRTNKLLNGWGLIIYGWNQRLPDILHSVFFPQDIPAFPNFFPDSGANWSSVSAWLPLFSMCGVIAFLLCKKGHWLKRIIVVSFVFALIPGLNAIFILLIDSYYGRWFFMPILMMCLATIMALDDPEVDFMKGIKWTTFFTAAFVVAIGLIPQVDNNNKITQIGLEKYPDRFWIYVAIVGVSILLTYIFYKLYSADKTKFANIATIAVTIIVCIFGNYFISTGKTYSYDSKWYESTALDGINKLKMENNNGQYDYRVDVINGMDNMALFWRMPTIQAFNSVVSSSIMKFYPPIGVVRDVASRPQTQYAGLRPFLSVKYLFDPNNSNSLDMPGWVPDGNQLGFKIWKNTNYIPYGFTFTNYITQSQFDNATQKDRILLKGLLLSKSQIDKYQGLLTPMLDQPFLVDYSDQAMAEDCAARRSQSCTDFKYDNTGFSAKITLDRPNLVLFTVPYDKGWTATVNGKPVEIENVDIGFMAIKCDTGASTIRFNYMTPGLITGIIITCLSIIAFVLYILFLKYVIKKPAFVADKTNQIYEISEANKNEEVKETDMDTESLPPADDPGDTDIVDDTNNTGNSEDITE